jgi:hypothetical protein
MSPVLLLQRTPPDRSKQDPQGPAPLRAPPLTVASAAASNPLQFETHCSAKHTAARNTLPRGTHGSVNHTAASTPPPGRLVSSVDILAALLAPLGQGFRAGSLPSSKAAPTAAPRDRALLALARNRPAAWFDASWFDAAWFDAARFTAPSEPLPEARQTG